MERVNGVAMESSRLAALQHMGQLRVEVRQIYYSIPMSFGGRDSPDYSSTAYAICPQICAL